MRRRPAIDERLFRFMDWSADSGCVGFAALFVLTLAVGAAACGVVVLAWWAVAA